MVCAHTPTLSSKAGRKNFMESPYRNFNIRLRFNTLTQTPQVGLCRTYCLSSNTTVGSPAVLFVMFRSLTFETATRHLRAKPEKIIVDLYAAKPSSRKAPCIATRMVS